VTAPAGHALPALRPAPATAPRRQSHVGALVAGAATVVAAAGGLSGLVKVVSVGLELVFVAFFLRHFAFAVAAMRWRPGRPGPAGVAWTAHSPTVSVLVACKNEEAVVDGLVRSMLAIEYPPDRLQLVVVDDGSTDRTGDLLDAWARREPRLRCLHRSPLAVTGKSAALNAGLAMATGDVIVVFDADHQPEPDTVRRLATHFRDPRVGAVQGRCEIRNAGDSVLARLVAIDYFAGYLVNEYGRQLLFQLPAYGGANCAVRARSVREVGGWNEQSVTEDTDLTLRLLLRGERVRYDVFALDREEGVATLARYWRQRYRWARGHQQVWRDHRRRVWASPRLTLAEKVETTMFLLVFHLPVAAAAGLLLAGLSVAGVATPVDPLHAFVLWTLLFLGPMLELGAGLLVARADRRDALVLVFFLPLFFVSIALCTKAWVDGVVGRRYQWVKTARAGDETVARMAA
jgi:cellulose synthase/poly-beta-1,6-N-acetylglucosamine synthase-like glycosyltransferase